jgi:hypothetical protein
MDWIIHLISLLLGVIIGFWVSTWVDARGKINDVVISDRPKRKKKKRRVLVNDDNSYMKRLSEWENDQKRSEQSAS